MTKKTKPINDPIPCTPHAPAVHGRYPRPSGAAYRQFYGQQVGRINAIVSERERINSINSKFTVIPPQGIGPNGPLPLPDKHGDDLPTEAKALAILVAHPDWTVTAIAEEVGCSRTHLYKLVHFPAALRLRAGGKNEMPGGMKDRDTGAIEAWDRPLGEKS